MWWMLAIDAYVNSPLIIIPLNAAPAAKLPMPTYTISELAREFDITSRAIRFYEDQGLLNPKREGAGGRIRVFTARERTRLKLTLRGKRLGFTLSEIKSLIDMYDSTRDSQAQLKRFLLVLAQHRETLEQQREDLEITLAEIAAHEAECRRQLNPAKTVAKNAKATKPTLATKNAAVASAKSPARAAKRAA